MKTRNKYIYKQLKVNNNNKIRILSNTYTKTSNKYSFTLALIFKIKSRKVEIEKQNATMNKITPSVMILPCEYSIEKMIN